MLTLAPASRLFCAITFALVVTPAFADWDETPEYAWKTYLSDCQYLQRAVNDVESGRRTAKEVLPYIESQLRTIRVHRKNLGQPSLSSPDYARCESLMPQVQDIAAKGSADYNEEIAQQLEKNQTEHLNSAEYKRARSLGFSDVGEIGALDEHAQLDGEENLKTLMIKVDFGCGRHFRAAYYAKPYVIYTVHRSDGSCGVYKHVAVLGGEMVERGDFIDEQETFQYVGWKKLAGPDGFPIDTQVVKVLK